MIITHRFAYLGPNRRSDLPVYEVALVLTPQERSHLQQRHQRFPGLLTHFVTAARTDRALVPAGSQPDDSLQQLAIGFSALALHIQQCMGHQVADQGIARDNAGADIQLYFEYDDQDIAHAVADFCANVFCAWLQEDPCLDAESLARTLSPQLHALIADGRRKATPADTRAIIDAARERGIPWVRLEKTGHELHEGDFRLRKNTLLNLGFGCHRTMIDSTFCVDKSHTVFALIRNRHQLMCELATLAVPIPPQDLELGVRHSVTRVALSAARIGYPVTLRSSLRNQPADAIANIGDRAALEVAAESLLRRQRGVMVERYVPGREYRAIVANTQLQAVLACATADDADQDQPTNAAVLHPETLDMIGRIAQHFPVGILEIRLVTDDLSQSLAKKGAFIDVNIAPVLADLAAYHPALLKHIALAFVDWIYPDPAASRIPVFAVTGTNGKTSTCRMIDQALRHLGRRTGLACTDGIYINRQLISEGDSAGFPGHLSVLSAVEVETAVLESARGGAASMGLGFDRCDVAVCLAVTEDHLGDSGINTLEEMAALKLSIVQRASKAVVLNADNPHSASMQHQLPGRKLCLVSTQRTLEQLRTDHPGVSCFAVLTQRDGEPWICLYDGDTLTPVISIDAIPATCGGAARHYVSNAMHAIAACYLGDVPEAAIRDALASFILTYETTPGRLNIHRGGGVTVVIDFAQNPDSLRELIRFTESIPVPGRRILGLSCSALNSDTLIRETAMAAAGQFDHYVCKNFKASEKRYASEVPRLLSEGLLSSGVDTTAITIIEDAIAAVEALVAMARDGDLLVVMTGSVHRAETWAYVTEHLK